MDLLERWFNISPDGGSGTFEMTIILTVIIVVCALVFRRKVQTVRLKRLSNVACQK